MILARRDLHPRRDPVPQDGQGNGPDVRRAVAGPRTPVARDRHFGAQAVNREAAIIEVPFHLGVEGLSVGAGPRRLLEAGADQALGRGGRPAQVEHVRLWDSTAEDLDAVVDVNRQIARAVRLAIEQDMLPVVLAGNCNSCLGTLAGLQGEEVTGIVWLDAHGDFNTPETSVSGLLEGMSLAAATGVCHDDLRIRCGLHDPVAGRNVLMLGVRDLDPGEDDRLAMNQVTVRPPGALEEVGELLVALRQRVQRVYLHLDADVLDPDESPGVNHRPPGGLPVAEAANLLRMIVETIPVAAVAVTNYNPERDEARKSERALVSLLPWLLVNSSPPPQELE